MKRETGADLRSEQSSREQLHGLGILLGGSGEAILPCRRVGGNATSTRSVIWDHRRRAGGARLDPCRYPPHLHLRAGCCCS